MTDPSGVNVAGPDLLPEADPMTAAERETLLSGSRGKPATTEPNFPHRLLEAWARDHPDAVAVVDGDVQVTFRELDCRANQLAHHFQALGVGAEPVVAIALRRSVDLVTAAFAVHKAGGALLLLDPRTPIPRLTAVLETVRPAVILTCRADGSHLTNSSSVVVPWEDLADHWRELPDSPPEHRATPRDAAYLFLTSGSTGTPKIVVEEFGFRRALTAGSKNQRTLLVSDSGTTFTLSAALSVASGATLFILPDGFDRDLPRFADFVRRHEITFLGLTPSALNLLLDLEDFLACRSLRRVVCLGEMFAPRVRQRFLDRMPGTELVVLYGCTEGRGCLSRPCSREDDPAAPDVGRPTPGMEAFVLDPNRRLCPIGVPGELHIGGQIARGYLNNPEATRAQFIPHPFDPAPGARLFATRDRALVLPNGTFQILGRLDHQVKIRGFRVELGEIEAVLGTCELVRQCAVVALEDAGGETSLAAFVVPTDPVPPPDVAAWGWFLRHRLPDHMVPARFIALPALPLTASGKIDRLALAAQAREIRPANATHVAPRSETERTLTAIWEAVLGRQPVGIHDPFFEIGGNSLSAVRLMFEVRRQLRWSLSLTTLVEHPTISRLAAQFGSHTDSSPGPVAAPDRVIHGTGRGPVLFFIPGIPGVNYISDIVRQRAAAIGRFCDALQFPGVAADESPLDTVPDLAREMIVRLRRIYPAGPIALAGYSLGGVVAFEMARQLASRNEAPALVLLYDAFTPDAFRRRTPLETVRTTLRHLRGLGAAAALRFLGERLRQKNRVVWAREVSALQPPGEPNDPAALARKRLFDASFRATRTLPVGPVYRGLVVLLRARDRDVAFGVTREIEAHNGWDAHVPDGLVVEDIPGDHWKLLHSDHAIELADRTAHWLTRLQAPCA